MTDTDTLRNALAALSLEAQHYLNTGHDASFLRDALAAANDALEALAAESAR